VLARANTGARKAAAVDLKSKLQSSPACRIEGQIAGCKKWSKTTATARTSITQIASVQEALRGVARNLMHHITSHCATKALRSAGSKNPGDVRRLLELNLRAFALTGKTTK